MQDWSPQLRAAVGIALVAIVLATALTYARRLGDGKSAFVRWRPQVLTLVAGGDVYVAGDHPAFPNPPLMALLLFPLAALPVAAGAWLWFALKVVLATLAVRFALEAAAPHGPPLDPPWAIAAIAVSLRPILSDLQHGNANILVLFLLMAGLRALQRDRDVAAGAWVALATALKLTPGLVLVYFAWKRWWRACAAGAIGTVAFTVLPALVLGVGPLRDQLAAWWSVMPGPFVADAAVIHTKELNQSLGAVVHRYLTDSPAVELHSGMAAFNFASLEPDTAETIARVLSIALLAAVALVCRAPGSPRGLRIASEYGLVLIAMLAISPRSWKHHYVVMALPYACALAWAARPEWREWRSGLLAALAVSQLCVLSTSRDLAKAVWFVDEAHKWAQGLGAYLASAVVVLAALAAVLVRARRRSEATASVAAREGVARPRIA